jgi:phage tail protein X
LSTYTTKSGDIWDLIAYEQLGDCKYVSLLMEANPQHLDAGVFSAGVVLTLPEITDENKVKNLPPWRR